MGRRLCIQQFEILQPVSSVNVVSFPPAGGPGRDTLARLGLSAARMPPAPVRTPSKKTIAALPESSRLTFLLAASQLLASSAPQASRHLGCQALRVN